MVHHGSCSKSLAWDIADVPCHCPRFWPRKESLRAWVASLPKPLRDGMKQFARLELKREAAQAKKVKL